MLKTFKKKIDHIEDQVEEVFTRLIKASTITFAALDEKDPTRFKETKNSLKNVDEICDKIDSDVTTTLALFSPEAKDLRQLVSYLKITSVLHKLAQNIKSYNKVAAKNFEDFKHYFEENKALITLQQASLHALETTLEIVREDDEKLLEGLYKKITEKVDETDKAYETIEQEILKDLSTDTFEAQIALLKTFRKLDKITNRAFDISTTLLCSKLNQLPLLS